MKKSITDIFYELVSIQSDTGTELEYNMAKHILALIENDDYFKKNSGNFGEHIGSDPLKRPVIWALKKGKSNKTIILTGHYDCVEINCYGDLRDYALNPDELKKRLKKLNLPNLVKADINSEDWVFGRGVNDMKAGIAISLHTLFNNKDEDVNILFLGVHDEENLSSGMRQSVNLLVQLKEKYNLDYSLMVLTEPHVGEKNDRFKVSTGTVGKIIPAIVVKGQISHGSEVMSGLNSSYIMSKIIKNIELNYNLCSKDLNVATQPPTVLYNRDLKELYDVSVPEYSASYFNYQFLKDTNTSEILQKIISICNRSVKEVLKKYDTTFDYMYKNDLIKLEKKREFNPIIITYKELEEIASENNENYIALKKAFQKNILQLINSGKINIQEAGIRTIKKIIELSKLSGIVVVVGFIPPYYPAVKNHGNLDDYLNCLDEVLLEKYKLKLSIEPYFMGICDISYTACTDIKNEKEIMSNMVVQSSTYNIDFKQIQKLNIPSIVLGPLGKDYHTMYERVYIKDVVDTVPNLINSLISHMNNEEVAN